LQAPREAGAWVQAAAGQRVQNVELRMARESVITGRVFDTNGKPVVGASAALLRPRYDEYGSRRLAGIRGVSYPGSAWSFARTDDRGEFRLYGLQAGDYYLRVAGDGVISTASETFYPGTLDETKAVAIRVEAGEELRLGAITRQPVDVKPAQVRFHFNDNGNLPIIREVWLRRDTTEASFTSCVGSSCNPAAFKTGVTDQLGLFVVRGLSPGAYSILAWEDVETGAYQDPEFLKELEDRGTKITVERGSRNVVNVRAIPNGVYASSPRGPQNERGHGSPESE
jgi:hypothetical protein